MEVKELTKAEEQIMQVLWKLNSAFVKEVIDELPEPKPAYNTVSTIIRILKDLCNTKPLVKVTAMLRPLVKKAIKVLLPKNSYPIILAVR
jgi:hypothetical protein